MGPLEATLRRLCDLHALIREGKGDTEEADQIRNEMDGPYGWCAPVPGRRRLSEAEKELVAKVSAALYEDEEKG